MVKAYTMQVPLIMPSQLRLTQTKLTCLFFFFEWYLHLYNPNLLYFLHDTEHALCALVMLLLKAQGGI